MSDFGRRSNRSRKAVDYIKLDSVGSDDDDFKDLSPPLKRQKQKNEVETKKRKNEVLKEIQSNTSSSIVKRKERVPVTEKVFERHLQVALELSTTSDMAGAGLEKARSELKEVVPSKVEQVVAASKSKGMQLQEQEDGEDNSNQEFDSDASDWSDTEKNSKSKHKKNERKIGKHLDENQKSVQTTRVRPQVKVHQERTITPKPPPRITSTCGMVKTPSTGLRLGLSRKISSKPLHPVVKAQH